MNYTYKRTITIETEDEQPLLGQNLQSVASTRLDEPIRHALQQAIQDGRATQTIKVGHREFVVRIQDHIRHKK